ncbi:MAG: Outer membrane lipoprotein-sorting protein [uncultured Thiotrichaceae bacterium]|uniref:Outer membrane lipoprotein-sorting protein n=1 Tax=uncultured Thiotrichaceae bacterium TaxID=298394 RepID=A0A6S6TAR2_9GAMM|nr:MAG: Outer membrane lipoprotein-sorting protein [uncultured Thiotrichaceae bacterium]
MKTITALAVSLSLITASAFAETSQEKGLGIAKAADARDTGFQDFTADMQMILKNRAGKTSTRSIRIKTLEVLGDGDKSMSLFDTPADIKGTTMLTYSHGLKPDDQWLYLPALKRVKRINSRNKSGPFMGSEFAFEDLGSQEVEKYRYNYLRDEPCGQGWTCHVIERKPAYQYSGYTRQVVWIDNKEYRPTKIEFYDRKNSKLKTLVSSGYREYAGYWRPARMQMDNHQTGKSTTLNWNNYTFKVGLRASDFNKNAIKRR